jgi:hypothetical protein
MTDTVVTLEEIAVILDGMTHGNSEDVMGFDMSHDLFGATTSLHPCGTACCIGGWVHHLNPNLKSLSLERGVCAVSSLSYNTAESLCYSGIALHQSVTPQQGAQAIRNAIEFNNPRWNEVLGLY